MCCERGDPQRRRHGNRRSGPQRRGPRDLATPVETRISGAHLLEILEFTLGHERYAFASTYVREVFSLTEITPLPGLPSHVLGVVNVRGRILSVMDIRRLLDFPNVGLTNLNKAIILHNGEMEAGCAGR